MSLLDTYLQNIRVNYPSLLDRDELRMIKFGLVDAAFAQTESPESILSDDIKRKAIASQGRLIQVPVLQKGSVTITNTRTCTVTPHENTSELIDVVWTTLVANITMVPAQYEKNEVGYLSDLARKIVDVKEAMLQIIEDAIYAKLDADKTQVFASTLVGVGGKYPLVANTLQVAAADWDFFFNDIKAIQQSGDYNNGTHYIVGSTNLMPTVEQYMNQGPGNTVNTNFQFGDKVFRFSNDVVDGAGVRATGFFMPNGTIGILTRVDIDARNNSRSTNGKEWSTTVIDGMPFEVGVRYDSDCSDQSGLNGSGMEHASATLYEKWQFSVDFALLTPYNSNPVANEGAIKKFELIP